MNDDWVGREINKQRVGGLVSEYRRMHGWVCGWTNGQMFTLGKPQVSRWGMNEWTGG